MDILRPTRHEQSVAMGHSRLVTLLSEGLVGCWRFEEPLWNGTAGEVKDISGLGHHGAAQNGLLVSPNGGKIGGGSGTFNGTTHYIDCGSHAIFNNLTRWTLLAWVKRNTNGGKRLLAKSTPTSYDYFMQIDASNYLQAGFIDTSAGNRFTTVAAPAPIVPLNKWALCVATFDGKHIRLFQDGVLVSSSADFSAFTPRTDTQNFWIGRLASASYYSGNMDECAVWNRALSETEVARLHNAGAGLAIL